MLKFLLKLKNSKKGFTMVEMIVVLVIIAILAAVSVPTMIGYVQRARDSQYIAEARVGFTAAQACVTEAVALSDDGDHGLDLDNPSGWANFPGLVDGVNGTFSGVVVSGNTVTGITYNPDSDSAVTVTISETNGAVVTRT